MEELRSSKMSVTTILLDDTGQFPITQGRGAGTAVWTALDIKC